MPVSLSEAAETFLQAARETPRQLVAPWAAFIASAKAIARHNNVEPTASKRPTKSVVQHTITRG